MLNGKKEWINNACCGENTGNSKSESGITVTRNKLYFLYFRQLETKTDHIYKISKISLLDRIVDELVDHIWFFHLRVNANGACLIYFKLYSDWHVGI